VWHAPNDPGRCLWVVLFRLLVELPFIFLANTLGSLLALFLFLHGRLRDFSLNVVCVCSVDDAVIFGTLASPLRCSSCWSAVQGWVEEFGTYTEGGRETVRRGIFRQIFLEWISEVGLTRVELGLYSAWYLGQTGGIMVAFRLKLGSKLLAVLRFFLAQEYPSTA
jgi:hypothetical protein